MFIRCHIVSATTISMALPKYPCGPDQDYNIELLYEYVIRFRYAAAAALSVANNIYGIKRIETLVLGVR